MKRTLTLLSLALCTMMAQAQITFVSTDVPTVPWTHVLAKDTSIGTVNWGSKGANQTYTFTNYQRNIGDTAFYLAPTSSQLGTVPNATIAITGDHTTFLFAKNSSTLFDFEGLQSNISGNNLLVAFSPVDPNLKFPTQYNGAFSGTYGFTKTVAGSAVGQPAVNQVRVNNTTLYYDTIDGWGKVTTPVGSYKCLRQKRIENSTTVIEYNLCGICPWTPLQTVVSNTTRYYYLTKEAKGSVVSFTYDSLNNPTSISWSLIPPAAPVARFGETHNAGGAIAFHDSTDGYPTGYSWNYGDGSALGTTQNPTHNYAANGTYYVCLTVTNAGGSNVWCDSVRVTNVAAAGSPPSAVNDTASVTQPGTVTIHAAANDINNNPGDTLCITAVWGAPTGWATVSGCGNIVFHPLSPLYTGADTFYYKVCDVHMPTLCDTGMVVVHVKPAAAIAPPVAVNDTASVRQPGTVSISATANDINNNPGDTLCITAVWGAPAGWASVASCSSISFHPLDPNFTGADTFYYRVCDIHLPALCDTGRVIVQVTASFIPPVAGFTTLVTGCTGRTFTSTSVGADTISWAFTEVTRINPHDTTIAGHSTLAIAEGQAPFAGHTYQVCLTARNQSGADQVCDTVAFTCLGIGTIAASDIHLYPNPATSEIKVDLSASDLSGYATIEVYGILGEKLKSVPVTAITTVHVSDLSNGVYVIAVHGKDNSTKVLGKFEIIR